MAGTFVNAELRNINRFQDKLNAIILRAGNAKPAYKIAGQVLLNSVRKNFRSGGRPDKWEKNSPKTKKKPGEKILVRRGMAGGLMGSINYQAFTDQVLVGTNKIYGAIQQYGGRAGRNLSVFIPARPYLLMQPEDLSKIVRAFGRYLIKP